MTPTVGRIVHYQPEGVNRTGAPLAALITGLPSGEHHKGQVFLAVFRYGETDYTQAPYSETPQPGHWSWPPRA